MDHLTPTERIIAYAKYRGFSISAFEKSIGKSNNYLKNSKDVTTATLLVLGQIYPELSISWVITGKGEMIKSKANISSPLVTRPRIPYTAAAGAITNALDGIKENECEQIPVVPSFPDYDFTIIIKGDSMEPKYEGGDEVACKRVDHTSFIQWGKVHVLDTAQGIVIKRIYEDGDKIKCVSYNPEYPPFSIDKSEIYSISLVVGLLRI